MTDVIFLPGIIAPAAGRYANLLSFLPDIRAVTKDLEVYAFDEPQPTYSLEDEIAGVTRTADEAGFTRFHLYGHSGGGAVALAFAARHGDRVVSVAVDEPASDMTREGDAVYGWADFDEAMAMPPERSTPRFLQLQVDPEVELPPRPAGPPPPWMAKRPAGMRAFIRALRAHDISPNEYRSFAMPVLFTRGSRSHARWQLMDTRLQKLIPDFTSEVFEGLHHLNTSHQAEPERVALLLDAFWTRAEAR